jgi:hypothetical protein
MILGVEFNFIRCVLKILILYQIVKLNIVKGRLSNVQAH